MLDLVRIRRGSFVAMLTFAVATALSIGPVLAVGGGGGGGGGGSGGSGGSSGSSDGQSDTDSSSGNSGLDNLECKSGFVVDTKKHMCVPAQSGMVPDRDLTDYAYALALRGRYSDALATLDLLKDPHTAVALNYRGYATRKLGHLDEGIGYYLQAVEIDAAYPQVREYLGEAYISKGRVDLAKEQLAAIASLCGTTCEPYVDLADAIEDVE